MWILYYIWASICFWWIISHTHHQRNTANLCVSNLQGVAVSLTLWGRNFPGNRDQTLQAISSSMTSSKGVLWQRTRLIICNSFIVTSREHLDSKTSRIASIPCEDTSWVCMSGLSINVLSWKDMGTPFSTDKECYMLTSWSQASRSWKSGADGVNSSMSWLTKLHNRACLSRWRLDSKSSSEKPSSI